jgi:hypothetical protein
MAKFALITEGPSDQLIISNLLVGYYKNPDLLISPLQPKKNEPGNWHKVLEYCGSSNFKGAFSFDDYVIIQIDSDIFLHEELPDEYKIHSLIPYLNVDEIVALIKAKLVEIIGQEFYLQNQEKIIFAISVDSIECWLLPFFYQTQLITAKKRTGCLGSLNDALSPRFNFTIDRNNKILKYYETIVDNRGFRKNVHEVYHLNPSLEIFINYLEPISISSQIDIDSPMVD